jgi:hypothetical protein
MPASQASAQLLEAHREGSDRRTVRLDPFRVGGQQAERVCRVQYKCNFNSDRAAVARYCERLLPRIAIDLQHISERRTLTKTYHGSSND